MPCAIKVKKACDGETQRWPASVLEEPSSKVFALVARAFEFPTHHELVMTYTDPDGDAILITHALAQYGLQEAVACQDVDACLSLVVHASKAAAKEYLKKQQQKQKTPQPPTAEEAEKKQEDSLGPRPGMCVALDLGIPLREARELVARARRGDAIASRVVAPSAAFYAALADDSVFLDQAKFDRAYAAKFKVVHHGVECDVTGMNPIVGTRYHLIGKNYDVCEEAYARLPDAEKLNFVAIRSPHRRLPHHRLPKCAAPPQPAAPAPAKTTTEDEAPKKDKEEVEPAGVPDLLDAPAFREEQESPRPTDLLLAPPTEEDEEDATAPPPYEPPQPSVADSEEDLVVIAPPPKDAELDHAIGVSLLTSMGFHGANASDTLKRHGSVEKAVESLINQGAST